jgi:L-fuconolactonase
LHGLPLVCDSQVHAPDTPRLGPIPGLQPDDLLRRMDEARVDRCIVVPMVPPGPDPMANNAAAAAMAEARPDRFGVMAPFDLRDADRAGLLRRWRSIPGMLGVRLAFLRDPNLSTLREGGAEWFWSEAEESGIPVMLLAPGLSEQLGRLAARHPGLRLVIDHLNLHPAESYRDLETAVQPLLELAAHSNVAVKASALPCWASDGFPYRSVHGAVRAVVDAFGARRVFWGSDLTRLPCSYLEGIHLFTEEMDFLSADDLEWIMGRAVVEWLGWTKAG